MKKLCCLLLILFFLTAAAAEPVNKHERQAPEKKPPRQVLPKQKLPEVKPFIPSEKIDADAVVLALSSCCWCSLKELDLWWWKR